MLPIKSFSIQYFPIEFFYIYAYINSTVQPYVLRKYFYTYF